MLRILVLTGLTGRIASSLSCLDNPCFNNCECETSCKDENDYYCRPQVGFPFIGKNCEFEAIPLCSNQAITIRIPAAAVLEYARGIPNVGIHGCARGICHRNAAICGPSMINVHGFFELSCPVAPTFNGVGLTKGVTFVMDRNSDLISMPRAITRVECKIEVRPAVSIIRPEFRNPPGVKRVETWTPIISFWKTPWKQLPGVPANNLAIPGGAIVYIVGEILHVRLSAQLSGAPASTLSKLHSIGLDTCTLDNGSSGGSSITIIENGQVRSDVPFPVSIDAPTGFIGGGYTPEGVGFHFQMFQFKAGSQIFLNCQVHVNPARRRRRDVDTPIVDKISVQFIVVRRNEVDDSNELDDVSTVVIKEKSFTDVFGNEADIKDEELFTQAIKTNNHGIVITCVVLAVFIVIAAVYVIQRRRYQIMFI